MTPSQVNTPALERAVSSFAARMNGEKPRDADSVGSRAPLAHRANHSDATSYTTADTGLPSAALAAPDAHPHASGPNADPPAEALEYDAQDAYTRDVHTPVPALAPVPRGRAQKPSLTLSTIVGLYRDHDATSDPNAAPPDPVADPDPRRLGGDTARPAERGAPPEGADPPADDARHTHAVLADMILLEPPALSRPGARRSSDVDAGGAQRGSAAGLLGGFWPMRSSSSLGAGVGAGYVVPEGR